MRIRIRAAKQRCFLKKKLFVPVVNEEDVKSNLLTLIQSLGEYLTHEDDSIRAKGNYFSNDGFQHD